MAFSADAAATQDDDKCVPCKVMDSISRRRTSTRNLNTMDDEELRHNHHPGASLQNENIFNSLLLIRVMFEEWSSCSCKLVVQDTSLENNVLRV